VQIIGSSSRLHLWLFLDLWVVGACDSMCGSVWEDEYESRLDG
jgi:hypothetical protein